MNFRTLIFCLILYFFEEYTSVIRYPLINMYADLKVRKKTLKFNPLCKFERVKFMWLSNYRLTVDRIPPRFRNKGRRFTVFYR